MNSCLPSEPKLAVAGLKKSFGDTPVLADVSLVLREKEFVSLLGLSGSGKTTVFNIIAGLVRPDAGRVLIDGADWTGKTGRVSYMYQKDLLLPWKTVLDNVCLPLTLHGEPLRSARARAAEYFRAFDLAGFEHRYPFQLSGGMRQRAALMRTFFQGKDLMLLDEPFGALDALTKRKMEQWLLDMLPQLKAAVLFITHDVEEAVLLSDRIYVLTARPARVREEIRIGLPRPRPLDLTTTPDFNAYKRRIINAL